MITEDNLTKLLDHLGFNRSGHVYAKLIGGTALKVDLVKKQIIYPEEQGLKINERQTCNFSSNENFVVFECVHRLLEKGYKPEHLELEPRWKVGRGASGGRADILVRNQQDKPLLLIECKTPGPEFEEAWRKTRLDGDQLFSYAQQISETRNLCLYASDFLDDSNAGVRIEYRVITHKDNDSILGLTPTLIAVPILVVIEPRLWYDTGHEHGRTKTGSSDIDGVAAARDCEPARGVEAGRSGGGHGSEPAHGVPLAGVVPERGMGEAGGSQARGTASEAGCEGAEVGL